ncbi:MAG: ABC transporter permease [Gemmatimonadetes bacterium]|nr:ABC transporter permease [Gemmatimonadota bacterium]
MTPAGHRWLARLGPLLALLLAAAFFATQSPRFLSAANASLILQQVMVVGVLAIGQTLVILAAGIDLSCGMVMALGSVAMSLLATRAGFPAWGAVAGGVALTAAVGAVNGLLVTRLSLPPFIVTLGTMNVAFAVTQLVSRSQSVTGLPDGLTWLGNTVRVAGAPVALGTLAMLGAYGVAWWLLRDTAAGRHLYAVGSHRDAARLAGIDTDRVLLGAYILSGVCAGAAALLAVARTGVGDPQAGQTENLDTVTAVVLGGTSLFGGRGVVLGTLVGAMIVGVFRNGLTLMGVSSVYQVLITGVLVILAVATDQWSRSRQ